MKIGLRGAAMSVSDNFAAVSERVARAAERSQRSADNVKLICVTKTLSAETINEAIRAGAKYIGESRVQDWLDKRDALLEAELHWIGALQTNKVKRIVGHADVIHSLDRAELAQKLSELALEKNAGPVKALVQVNIGTEPSKSGVHPDRLIELLETISELRGIQIVGLMCIPPVCSPEEARKYFARLRELREKARAQNFYGISFDELSMGMSGDFEEAIIEGATMVRVGTAIFGSR